MSLSNKTLEKISAKFKIGEIKSVKLLPGGNINYNYITTTKKNKFIVRKLGYTLDGWFSHQKPFEFQVLEFLNKNKFPYQIPEMIKNDKGKYISKIEGNLFQVYPLIQGKTVKNLNLPQIKNAAKALAKYHELMKKFPGKKEKIDDLRFATSNYQKLRSIKPKNDVDKFMIKNLNFFESILKESRNVNRNKNILVVHGDFNKANLLFEGDKLSGILDFENVAWAPRMWELTTNVTDGVDNLKNFVKEYTKHNPISKKERELIVPLKLLKNSEVFAWLYLGRHKIKERKLDMLRYILKRQKELYKMKDLQI